MAAKTPSGNCAVEVGLPCVVPDERKKFTSDWALNWPTIISFFALVGVFGGYALNNQKEMTENKKDKEILATVDKGIMEHQAIMDQLAIRDRAEMRADIKETKEMVKQLYERKR
jgi:hypothetical protein